MKKVLSIVFAVICSFAFFSCSKENQMDNNSINTNEVIEEIKEEVKIESLNGLWKQDTSYLGKENYEHYEIEIKNDKEISIILCGFNINKVVASGYFETPSEPFSKATIDVKIRVNNTQTRSKNIFYDNGILSFVPEPFCGEPVLDWEDWSTQHNPLPVYLELVTE